MIVVLIILCSSHPLSSGLRVSDRYIVWNVGQGLWITVVGQNECDHFDAGGEHWPLRLIREFCTGKKNRVSLSHADLDHIGGLKSLRGIAPGLCISAAPLDTDVSPRKRALYEPLPPCELASETKEIKWNEIKKTANEFSRVFTFEGRYLMPGDSPGTQENIWALKVPRQIEILILGHHGSRTSTTETLLQHLPNLKMAIASARQRKYGHPHKEVIERLEEHNIALIRTEDWGHVIFEM